MQGGLRGSMAIKTKSLRTLINSDEADDNFRIPDSGAPPTARWLRTCRRIRTDKQPQRPVVQLLAQG